MATDGASAKARRPGSYGILTSQLCVVFGVAPRRARRMVDRFPKEHIDKFGNERVVPVWLARQEWPNVFRDWPEAPPPVSVVTM